MTQYELTESAVSGDTEMVDRNDPDIKTLDDEARCDAVSAFVDNLSFDEQDDMLAAIALDMGPEAAVRSIAISSLRWWGVEGIDSVIDDLNKVKHYIDQKTSRETKALQNRFDDLVDYLNDDSDLEMDIDE